MCLLTKNIHTLSVNGFGMNSKVCIPLSKELTYTFAVNNFLDTGLEKIYPETDQLIKLILSSLYQTRQAKGVWVSWRKLIYLFNKFNGNSRMSNPSLLHVEETLFNDLSRQLYVQRMSHRRFRITENTTEIKSPEYRLAWA